MHNIFTKDGTIVEVEDDQVEVMNITSDNLVGMGNYKNGVTLSFKDGSTQFIGNAKTDGESIELYFEKD